LLGNIDTLLTVKRKEATKRLESVLAILAEATSEPVMRVTAIYVFGSYARGAAIVGDIDVDVEYEIDHDRARLEIDRLLSGQSAYSDLRSALFGGQRIFHAHFHEHDKLEEELGGLRLLWRRGETEETALARLRSFRLDPAAGRAARDPVADPLKGIVDELGRGLAQHLNDAITDGLLEARQIDLPDGSPRDREAVASIEDRWGPRNPLRRPALAAAAYLESAGFLGISAYGGPAGLTVDEGRALADFGTRKVRDVALYFEATRAELWLQVINPRRGAPLRALLLTPAEGEQRS